MTDDDTNARWAALCNDVTDRMKEFTRPYVTMLVSPPGTKPRIGTGTFLEHEGSGVLTCKHVADFDPAALFAGDQLEVEMTLGPWRSDRAFDVAYAPISASELNKCRNQAALLPLSRFAERSSWVASELLFFRGIAGENARYLGTGGSDVTLTGYCSQEKPGSGDRQIFEMLWVPGTATVTSGTADAARAAIKQANPQGLSGSFVWNTRFVERGCDLTTWTPDDAVVVGMLRHYDEDTNTLLAWRAEHIFAWLTSGNGAAS